MTQQSRRSERPATDAQQRTAIVALDAAPGARPEDVASPEAAVAAVYRERGFWEREVWHRTERFGNVTHVFSAYESRLGSPDSAPVGRGINSVQLARSQGRWWIASIAWDVETPANPIPENDE